MGEDFDNHRRIFDGGPSTRLLCGCQVTNTRVLFFSYDSFIPRPKRDSLLYVARPTAVTQTWNTSLCWAQCPGISVSRIEPSGVVSLSRFSKSSSRSLGHRLLLGQRSRINLFSHDIGSLLHQDHSDSRTEFTGHRDNGDSAVPSAAHGCGKPNDKNL